MKSSLKSVRSRLNGRISRGPKTQIGKERSSRNSLRHGLSAVSRHNPTYFAEIYQMAVAICGDGANPPLLEQALVIAENETILRLVAVERRALVEKFRDPYASSSRNRAGDLPMARLSVKHSEQAYEVFSQLYAQLVRQGVEVHSGIVPRPCAADEPPCVYEPSSDRDDFDALQMAFPDLRSLDRYERRAWSRRRKAIELFAAIRTLTTGVE